MNSVQYVIYQFQGRINNDMIPLPYNRNIKAENGLPILVNDSLKNNISVNFRLYGRKTN